MSPKITLYYFPGSPPSRAVMMCARALGIEVAMKYTDIFRGETMTGEFLLKNIQHTVPTLEDNGFFLNESKAIMQYLCNKYGTDETEYLYPKDPETRARVDMKLFFDSATFYPRLVETYFPAIFENGEICPKRVEKFEEALSFLEAYLESTRKYVAGDHITIADFPIAASLSTAVAAGHDLTKYPYTLKYLETLEREIVDYAELNQKGADMFHAAAKVALGLNK